LIGVLAGIVWFFTFAGHRSGDEMSPLKPVQAERAQAYILPISETTYLPIRNFNIPEPAFDAKSAALFDTSSARFLYSKNTDQKLPIASVTKLLSAIIILENINLEQDFVVPAENLNVDGLGADFSKDERISGRDLLRVMLIKSSNDAALTFATFAKSQGIDFVQKMNAKAREIGMLDSKFADPAGLNDQDAFSTASDLVKLVRYARNYPLIWEILKTKSADVASADGRFSHHLISTNQLLGEIPNIVGGKTGFTDLAQGTMVLEVGVNNGQDSIISVILGSKDRFGETKKLVEWGKKAYSWE
jgi:D-alanyl-D-alanine carboxypeptidase